MLVVVIGGINSGYALLALAIVAPILVPFLFREKWKQDGLGEHARLATFAFPLVLAALGGLGLVAIIGRPEILAALESVDYVVLFREETPDRLIRTVRPRVLVKGGDWAPEAIVGRDVVLAAGGGGLPGQRREVGMAAGGERVPHRKRYAVLQAY